MAVLSGAVCGVLVGFLRASRGENAPGGELLAWVFGGALTDGLVFGGLATFDVVLYFSVGRRNRCKSSNSR